MVRLSRLGAALSRLRRQGDSPHRLALGMAVGVAMGVAPLLMGTSLLCVALAWRLRLNHLAVQVGNFASYPVQLALFVPFLLAGQKLFHPGSPSVPVASWRLALAAGPQAFIRCFWQANLYALVVWLLSLPLGLGVSYLTLRWLLKRWPVSPYRPGRVPDKN